MLVMRDEQPELQSSAIILASQIIKQEPEILSPYLYQLFDFISGLFQFQTVLAPRRGNSPFKIVACLIMVQEIVQSFSFRLPALVNARVLTELRVQLEQIAFTANDQISQGHASAALASLKQLFIE